MAADGSLREISSKVERMGAAGKAAKTRHAIRCERWLRGGRRAEATALSNVRRRGRDHARGRRSPALNTIVGTDRAAWAMQKPPLVEWMAWRRYLIATRASSPAAYVASEEAAWQRLPEDLAQIESAFREGHSLAANAAARTTSQPRV
jgi:hypothetical protein